MLQFNLKVSGNRIIKCSKCEAEFTCQPQGDCWCNNYQLSERQLAELKSSYKDCLCENCISELSHEVK